MGLFSKVSSKVHQHRLKKAQKQAMRNKKLVLRYLALEEKQKELERVRKGGLSDKGREFLAKIKAEKAKIRAIRIVRAKKVAKIAGRVALSITRDIHELAGRIDKKKPKRRMKKKRKMKKKPKKRKRRKNLTIKNLL